MTDLKVCCTNHSTLPALNVPLRTLTLSLAAPECQAVLLPVSHTFWNPTSSSRKPSQMDQRGVERLLSECGSLVVTAVSHLSSLCEYLNVAVAVCRWPVFASAGLNPHLSFSTTGHWAAASVLWKNYQQPSWWFW